MGTSPPAPLLKKERGDAARGIVLTEAALLGFQADKGQTPFCEHSRSYRFRNSSNSRFNISPPLLFALPSCPHIRHPKSDISLGTLQMYFGTLQMYFGTLQMDFQPLQMDFQALQMDFRPLQMDFLPFQMNI
jgi:hypothetical protein